MMKIPVMALTPRELAAVRAVIDATLDCCGEHIKRREQGLDLYEALQDAQVKLARLSQARQAIVSA